MITAQTKLWMKISGGLGLAFCVIANLTNIFHGLSVPAGCIQLVINAIVFFTWLNAFRESTTRKETWFTVPGVVIPFIMASTTICRVLVPAFFR